MANIKINLDSLKARREWKRHKVVDGHNVYRILPPFGEASNGYPYRKWQICWGLKDPETGRVRPFASSLTSEKRCPVTEFVAELKKKSESLTAQLQASGASSETIKERMKALNALISDMSPKTVYVYNAANKAGEVGLLELKATAHKKMKALMHEYVQMYNQDPTSLNSSDDDSGVWFDITRTGQFRDTEYDVLKCQLRTKNAAGKITFEDDRSPLPESLVENYESQAYDLSSIYQQKSYDELQEVLEANMADIIAACPDANLSGAAVAVSAAPKPAAAAPAKPTRTINLNLNDDDDDIDETKFAPPVSAKKPVVAAPSLDDDFMAQADAILNG